MHLRIKHGDRATVVRPLGVFAITLACLWSGRIWSDQVCALVWSKAGLVWAGLPGPALVWSGLPLRWSDLRPFPSGVAGLALPLACPC